MIYCPKCETANRDGSKFCNECGERLGPQTQIKCPHCGELNAVQSVFCGECGGRLLVDPPAAPNSGSPAIKGLSLPSKTSVEDDEPEKEDEVEADETKGVPAWLRELGGSVAAGSGEEEPAADEASSEIPEWLRDLRASLPEDADVEFPDAEELEAEGIPDWLAELKPTEEKAPVEAPEPAAPPEEVEEGEVPDWLAEMEPAEEEAPVEAPEPTAPPEEVEEEEPPDWLAEMEPAEEEAPPLPSKEGEPLAEADLPDWLAGLEPELPEGAFPGEDLEGGELPDWLVPSEGVPTEGDLARAEIPEWLLELKPRELREGEEEVPPEEPRIEEPVEETGLLAGLQGTLPVEMLIAQPRSAPARDLGDEPLADSAEARLFAEIVAQPLASAPKAVAQPAAPGLSTVARWIIYVALILAVTVPLLLQEPLLTRTIEPAPAVNQLYEAIGDLDADAPVLVAFDYDPASSGEMDVVARALVGHLMDREARIVAVSLLPAGPPTAQHVLDAEAMDRSRYEGAYGVQYVNLGFVPGQAAAVRRLGQSFTTALPRDVQGTDLRDLEAMAGLADIEDLALIVELTASQNGLRWWIEQVDAYYDVRLAAGVAASVEPLARPYYETEPRQLEGLVGGVPGATVYEALRDSQSPEAEAVAARLDAQLAGHVILVLVLLIGNVFYLARRRRGES